MPTPINKSCITAWRFSLRVVTTAFTEAILYRRRLIQSEQAGIATFSAT